MSSFRFLDLPPELRNEVYFWALNSPTGNLLPVQRINPRRYEMRVSVLPGDELQTLGLFNQNLILTCKQVHSEASGLIYHYNTFIMLDPNYLRAALFYQPRHVYRIEHMWIAINVLDSEGRQRMEEALMHLGGCARAGNLRTLTFCLAHTTHHFRYLDSLWRVKGPLWERLVRTIAEGFAGPEWKGIKRTLLIRTRYPMDPIGPHKLDQLLRILHEAIGGDLVAGHRLCFRDGQLLIDPEELPAIIWQ